MNNPERTEAARRVASPRCDSYEALLPERDMEDFVVKHYSKDEVPTFKGNGFDGIRVGEDREEAQRLADYINALRKDAERYRKLRAGNYLIGPRVCDKLNADIGYTPQGLDAALDALPAVGAA